MRERKQFIHPPCALFNICHIVTIGYIAQEDNAEILGLGQDFFQDGGFHLDKGGLLRSISVGWLAG
jgi:hypothetical protein